MECRRSARFQVGMIAVMSPNSLKALPHQKPQVIKAIPPGVQFDFAQAGRILNRDLGEAYLWALQRLDLDLLGESHAVAFEFHSLEDAASKHPHAGLRIAHPGEVKQRHREGE